MKISRRGVALVLAGAIAIGLGILHLSYPLPYIARVMVYQDADYADVYRFRANALFASPTPRDWVVADDPAIAAAFETHPEIDSFEAFLESTDTWGFLVVRDGRLVAEWYADEAGPGTALNTFSVSILSVLIGRAQQDGLVDLDAAITVYLPELAERDVRFDRISVADLLNMRSGIRFSSAVEFPFVTEDNPLIYYHPDLESVLLERTEIDAAPGEFRYNNYNAGLVGLILRRVTGMSATKYAEKVLWYPLGAERGAGWTADANGFERMESGFHAAGRDLAKIGQLYLDRGRVGETEVIPESWVLASTREFEPTELERYDGRSWDYNSGWWIVPRPEGRPDFTAIGRFGQFIYVSPNNGVVFVRSGPDRGSFGDFDWTGLFFTVANQL